MPKVKSMHPDARREIKMYLVASMTTFLTELLKRYFKNPALTENRQVFLEAVAEAVHNLTAGDATHKATLVALATEILERQEQ